jgi:hypothetical protein
MTACCSSFHHDPMFASPGVFSAEASNIFKCGCSRTGDLNHQKKNESGDTVSWDHGIIPRGFKLWKHSETTRSSHPVRTGSRTEEVLTLWCSKQGRVSNLQVRGYMMINVATNAATIAVTWVEISETIWNQEGTFQNLFQALFSRACRAPNVVSSLHFN